MTENVLPKLIDRAVFVEHDHAHNVVTAQIAVRAQNSKDRNCGYHAIYNATLCYQAAMGNAQALARLRGEENGDGTDGFGEFCRRLKTTIAPHETEAERECATLEECIFERSHVEQAIQAVSFVPMTALVEMHSAADVKDVEKVMIDLGVAERRSTRAFLLGVVDHWVSVLVNVPLAGSIEILLFDSFNAPILAVASSSSPARLDTLAVSVGVHHENRRRQERLDRAAAAINAPSNGENADKDDCLYDCDLALTHRSLRYHEVFSKSILLIRQALCGTTSVRRWFLGNHLHALLTTFDAVAHTDCGDLSLPGLLQWLESYNPPAALRSRDLVLLRDLDALHHTAPADQVRMINWIERTAAFVRASDSDIDLLPQLLDVLDAMRPLFHPPVSPPLSSSSSSDCPTLSASVSEVFSRQSAVDKWRQDTLAGQSVLLLGVGGIGCAAALHLCRLGIGHLMLVDCDTVDASNLNRQVLFHQRHLGQRKVDAARETLVHTHRVATTPTIEAYHANVVTQFDLVTRLAQRATCIFNAVDVGATYDLAISSLCTRLNLSYLSASSWALAWVSDVFPRPSRQPCFACNNVDSRTSTTIPLSTLTPQHILEHSSIAHLMPAHDASSAVPTASVGSTVLSCTAGAGAAISVWLQSLFVDGYDNSAPALPHWTKMDLASHECFSYCVDPNPTCMFCSCASSPMDSPVQVSSKSALFFSRGAHQRVFLAPVSGVAMPHQPDSLVAPSSLSLPTHNINDAQSPPPKTAASPIVSDGTSLVASLARVSKAARIAAHSRLQPLSHKGSSLYLPCVPSADFLPHPPSASSEPQGFPIAYAHLLAEPLLKVPAGARWAWRSGDRSAVMPISTSDGTDVYLRLKGCGNFVGCAAPPLCTFSFPGMPFQALLDGTELRGSQFPSTVERELAMTERVARVLKPLHMIAGNRSVGQWRYDFDGDSSSLLAGLAGDARPCCGIFETVGERRLDADLLGGLERLLLTRVPPSQSQLDALASAIRRHCDSTESTRVVNEDGTMAPTWSACSTGRADSRAQPVDAHCSMSDDNPDLHHSVLLLRCALAPAVSLMFPTITARHDALSVTVALVSLMSRLGTEVALVLGALQRESINWGTFFDHSPVEPHCNAHPNNFVVLQQTTEAGQLIAPVDFDFAFERSDFFSPYTGEQDTSLFDNWLDMERKEMERALGGEQANSGVSSGAGDESCKGGSPYALLVRWLLRDTLVAAFQRTLCTAGAALGKPMSSEHDGHERILRAIIECALSA